MEEKIDTLSKEKEDISKYQQSDKRTRAITYNPYNIKLRMKDDALEEIEQTSIADISGRSGKYTKSKDVDCDIYNVAVIRKKQTCVRKRNTVYISGLEESTTNMRYCSRKETHINESVEDGNQYHD